VFAALNTSTNLSGSGNIVGIGISSNPASLNFGNLTAGNVASCTVVLSNSGNINEVLSMVAVGLPSYLSLAWNCSGVVLAPLAPQTALFTLTASNVAPIGVFSFNVVVTGTQV
jgi:hypothetical protein